MMSKFKLHPMTIIIKTFMNIKSALLPFLIIVVVNGASLIRNVKEEGFWANMIPFAVILVVIIATFVMGLIEWITFRYWFEEDELRIEYGLLVKKKRYIPFERIQSFNYKESIFHRLFGLVEVQVETAGASDGKAEAKFSAITKNAAAFIEKEINRVKVESDVIQMDEPEVIEKKNSVFKMSPIEQIVLATTSGTVGIIIAGAATFASQLSDILPLDWLTDQFALLVKYGYIVVTVLVALAFVAIWLLSIGWTLINYYNFEVCIENERIVITRGLLEKKKITIPLSRVQGVQIVENPVRQLLGFATVNIISAGGDQKELSSIVKLMPMIKRSAIESKLETIFPHLHLKAEFQQAPKRAVGYFYRLHFLWLLPLTAIVTYFTNVLGLLVLLVAIPLVLWGVWRHRTAAFAMTEQQLIIQERFISKTVVYVEKKRIQSMEMSHSYFQRKNNIATAHIAIKNGATVFVAKAKHMDQQVIEQLMNWFGRSN